MRIIIIKPRGIIHMVFRALALSYVITMVATSARAYPAWSGNLCGRATRGFSIRISIHDGPSCPDCRDNFRHLQVFYILRVCLNLLSVYIVSHYPCG